MADKGKEWLLFHRLIKIAQDNYKDQMKDAVSINFIILWIMWGIIFQICFASIHSHFNDFEISLLPWMIAEFLIKLCDIQTITLCVTMEVLKVSNVNSLFISKNSLFMGVTPKIRNWWIYFRRGKWLNQTCNVSIDKPTKGLFLVCLYFRVFPRSTHP